MFFNHLAGVVASGGAVTGGGGGSVGFTTLIDSYTPLVNYYMDGLAASPIADDTGNVDLSNPVNSAQDEQPSGWTGAGNGLYFDGGGYGDSSSSIAVLNSSTTGSIIICFDVDSIGSDQTLWSQVLDYDTSNYFRIAITSSGEIEVDITDGSYNQNLYRTTTASLSSGTNYSLVVTQDGTGWQVYINGVAQTVSTISESGSASDFLDDISSSDKVYMAVRGGYGTTEYFTGYIYHLAVVDTALGASDALDVYNAHSTGSS